MRNAQDIRDYLIRKFTIKEAEDFLKLLSQFEQVISLFPELYPATNSYPNLRKAVLHKNTSVYYSVEKDSIIVVAMQDNRQLKPGR
ncbi:type II toxin-antitoxin system RelE/ParE family toxin [Fulvivirga sp.]|uniref:type II toxin-antitoxin system RelE/ParE family toxin n=1 Tax=Fulvivirga sp. TaxID=1931237 RepID=UPI0032EB2402